MNVQIPDIICTITAGEVGTWHNIPHTGKQVRKACKKYLSMNVAEDAKERTKHEKDRNKN